MKKFYISLREDGNGDSFSIFMFDQYKTLKSLKRYGIPTVKNALKEYKHLIKTADFTAKDQVNLYISEYTNIYDESTFKLIDKLPIKI